MKLLILSPRPSVSKTDSLLTAEATWMFKITSSLESQVPLKISTIRFNQSFPKNCLHLISSSTGQLQNEVDSPHAMRTRGRRMAPPSLPGAPGGRLSPPGEPVTLQFMALAFQFHKQMVGGVRAQTEHLSPQRLTGMWAPATYQGPRFSGHLKCSPDTPWKPRVQSKVFISEAPFLLPPAPESTNCAASRRAPDTHPAANQRDTWQLDFRMLSPEVPASGLE